jgi:cytochrome c556
MIRQPQGGIHMLVRAACVVAALVFGATAVIAQDVIAERKALMKRSGDMAKQGTQMARGDAPYDNAKAQAVLAVFVDKAQKLPKLFPESSKSGDTRAAPAIWEKSAEWNKAIEKFGADAKAAQASAKDLDSFKAGFSAVGRNCGSCHETFRKS